MESGVEELMAAETAAVVVAVRMVVMAEAVEWEVALQPLQ